MPSAESSRLSCSLSSAWISLCMHGYVNDLIQNTAPLYISSSIFLCSCFFRCPSVSLSYCLSSLSSLLFCSCVKTHGSVSHDTLCPHILLLSVPLCDSSLLATELSPASVNDSKFLPYCSFQAFCIPFPYPLLSSFLREYYNRMICGLLRNSLFFESQINSYYFHFLSRL